MAPRERKTKNSAESGTQTSSATPAADASPAASLADLLRDAALSVVMTDADDAEQLAQLTTSLQRLQTALAGSADGERMAAVVAALSAGQRGAEATATLGKASALIDEIGIRVATQPEASEAASVMAAPPAIATPLAESVKATNAGRDSETIELIADFIAEASEGLARVDETLLAAEQNGSDSEQVNALFRVFHTIKGVAGFLALNDMIRLAHAAETLLDRVRKGQMSLEGAVLDVIFESSAAMRGLVEDVKVAVERDLEFAEKVEVTRLIEKLELVTAGQVVARSTPAARTSIAAAAAAQRATSVRPQTEQATPSPASSSVPPQPSEPAPEAASGHTQLTPRATGAASTALREEPKRVATEADAPRGDKQHPEGAAGARIRETLKVDVERVDSIVEMIGELIIVESMVAHAPELAQISSSKLRNSLSQLTKISRDLQDLAMRMRMVPVRGVFQKMARLVRDLSRKTGKKVDFVYSGESTEMDRSMVERIEEPLVHMIRNAMDHAIEPPTERLTSGKPEAGRLRLTAQHEGGSIAIILSDDGRGLRRQPILKKARQQGLIHDDGDDLSDAEVHELIFLPGFSTAREVSELSGRGVGMDVVRRRAEELRGRVTVGSKEGEGSEFKLILPLTLAIIDGMIVSCGGENYIIPSLSIVECLQPTAEMVRSPAGSNELVNVRGQILPMLRLARLFDVPTRELPPEQARIIVLESAGRKLGLLVDDVLTQHQVVIKPLRVGMGESDLLAGAAILSDGRVALILNVDRLSGVLGSKRRSTGDSKDAAA